jgi:hypothetical protein
VIATINPVLGHQNAKITVVVTGQYTHFVQGTTTASFGAQVKVNSVAVTNATSATVSITINAAAAVGTRTVTMTTGSENATLVNGFAVKPGIPQITGINPTLGSQGQSLTAIISSLYTHFSQAATTVSFGPGITTGQVTVNGPKLLSVPITIGTGVTPGPVSVTVSTNLGGGKTETEAKNFNILAGIPGVTQITPNTGSPSQALTVTVTAQLTNFVQGTTMASFGPGVQVGGAAAAALGPVTVTSPTSFTASLKIRSGASLGPVPVVVQTGAQNLNVSSGFTIAINDGSALQELAFDPGYAQTNVPLDARVTIQFNKPVDRSTVNATNLTLTDQNTSQNITGTILVDATGYLATFIPNQILAANHQYQAYPQSGITDTFGNALSYTYTYFTTGFSVDTTGPAVTATSPANNDVVGTNAPIVIQFSKPVDPLTMSAGVQSSQGGVPVAGTATFDTTYQIYTLTPASPLPASSAFKVAWNSQVLDTAGDPLTGPGSLTFSTMAGPDNTYPAVVATDPPSGQTNAGTNIKPHIQFSKPIDAIALNANNFYLVNQNTGHQVRAAIGVSSDRMTLSLTPKAALQPNTSYYCYLQGYAYFDLSGNPGPSVQTYFRTGAGPDTVPPTVVAINPPKNSTAVPTNASIIANFSYPIDPTSLTNGAIQMTPAVAGTSTLSTDLLSLTFLPSAALSSSTAYTVKVSGLKSVDGNTLTTFNSAFTTGAGPDTTPGVVSSTSPGSGALNVPVNSTIQFNFNKPIDPTSISTALSNGAYLAVTASPGGATITGSFTATGPAQATFTPDAALPANSTISVELDSVRDLAGNSFNSDSFSFSTVTAVDKTPPTVTSVTPANNATGAGRNTTVVISFSKPLNPATVASGTTIALFNGGTLLSTNFRLSADNTTISGLAAMPASSTITVAATSGITDLAGNHLADFRSQFTTAADASATAPTITGQIPASGSTNVSANAPITFYVSEPVNPGTVAAAVQISVNGVLVTGTPLLSDTNQVITFTPSVPFAAGSIVQPFLTTALQDTSGNSLSSNYYGQFTVAPDLTMTAATVTNISPQYAAQNAPLNSVYDIQFDKALNPSTVSASTIGISGITSTVTLMNNNTTIRIKPSAALLPSTNYSLSQTGTITDVNGLNVSIAYYYFVTGTTSITSAPTVSGIAPPAGAAKIGVNAPASLTFSRPIDPTTVSSTSIQVISGGAAIPASSITFDSTYMNVIVAPQTPLPANTPITVKVNGVQDVAGNSVTPYTSQFSTGAGPDFAPPTLVSASVAYGQANVPVNSAFTLQFSKPIDARTVNAGNLYLTDQVTGLNPVVTFSQSADGTTVTITPTVALNVGRLYYLDVYYVQDLAGNQFSSYYSPFTTSFVPNTNPPQVTGVNPPNGFTNVGINANVQVQFNEAVQPASLGGIQLLAGTTVVPATASLSAGPSLVTLTPNVPLTASTVHTISVTGVRDTAGNVYTGTSTYQFTTGKGADLTTPAVTSTDPVNQQINVGTNVVIRLQFNKPVNPLSFSASPVTLTNANTSATIPGTFTISADAMSAAFAPSAWLQTGTLYTFGYVYFADQSGNSGYSYPFSFTTGSGSDTNPPTVLAISPPASSAGVPVNAPVVALLSKPIDPTSIGPNSIQLTPAVSAAVSLASDQVTLTFTPSANLAVSTTYAVKVSGFRDTDGNAVTAFVSSFVTSSSNVPDTTPGTVTNINPMSGATNVPVTSPVVITFSKPVDPATVNLNSINISIASVNLAGALALNPTGTKVTFTPATPYPANATVYAYISYYAYVKDIAGNAFSSSANSFTAANTADNQPLTVTSVSPQNNAAGVGRNVTISLTFSAPVNSGTTANNIAVFSGQKLFSGNLSISADGRTVSLSRTLPASTAISVIANSSVTDVYGNPLTPFSSQFTTAADNQAGAPSVVTQIPGNGSTGVPGNTPVTLYLSNPVNASTLSGNFVVSQNGALITGTTLAIDNGQAVVFTPAVTLTAGALIQVFLTNAVQDINGNAFTNYTGQFTVQPDLSMTPASVSLTSPTYGSSNVPLNTVFDLQFNKPLNPATVNGSAINLYDNSNGHTIVSTVTLRNNNTAIRIKPTANLSPSAYIYLQNSGTIQDVNGLTASIGSNYFITGTAAQNTTTTVAGIAPPNGALGMGVNALIRVTFSLPVDPATVTATTVKLTSGAATLVPASISLNGANTTVTITPQSPLPANAMVTVAVNGVQDGTGKNVTAKTITFSTGGGPDLVVPAVVSSNVSNYSTLPVNTAFSVQFSKPIDLTSIAQGFYLTDASSNVIPGTYSASASGTQLTFLPSANLTPSSSYYLYLYYFEDLAGNTGYSGSYYFYTAAGKDTTPPTVIATNPFNNASGVPVNALLNILFSKPVSPTSLSGLTLTAGGNPVTVTPVLANSNQTVSLALSSLLASNTAYVLSITGVKDIAGNALAGTVTANFQTGSTDNLNGPTVSSFTPSGTGIPVNVKPRIVFSGPIDPTTALSGEGIFLSEGASPDYTNPIPATLTLSADYKTVTLTPSAALAHGTQYTFSYSYGPGYVTDPEGNYISPSLGYQVFTTAP